MGDALAPPFHARSLMKRVFSPCRLASVHHNSEAFGRGHDRLPIGKFHRASFSAVVVNHIGVDARALEAHRCRVVGGKAPGSRSDLPKCGKGLKPVIGMSLCFAAFGLVAGQGFVIGEGQLGIGERKDAPPDIRPLVVHESRGQAIGGFTQAQGDVVPQIIRIHPKVQHEAVHGQGLDAEDMGPGAAEEGREGAPVALNNGGHERTIARGKIVAIRTGGVVPINVRPVFPYRRRLGRMEVDSALREGAVSRREAIEHHGAVGIRRFRGGLIVVSANEIHLSGGRWGGGVVCRK